MAPGPEAARTLRAASTATLATALLKKGLRNVWMRGARPLCPGQPRMVGEAFTLRFLPAREDLATPASWTPAITPWLGARFIAELALGRAWMPNDPPGSPGSGVDFPPFGRRHPLTARRSWKIRRSKL